MRVPASGLSALRAANSGRRGRSQGAGGGPASDQLSKMDGNIGRRLQWRGVVAGDARYGIDAGGKPANFRISGPRRRAWTLRMALNAFLENPSVQVLLINIHGGACSAAIRWRRGWGCDAAGEARGAGHRAVCGEQRRFRAGAAQSVWCRLSDARDLDDAIELVMAALAKEAA